MKRLSLLTIFCLGTVIFVFSQNKLITKEEYRSALGSSVSKAEKTAYRMTDITKFFSNKKQDEVRTFIRENLPPDKKRWVSTREKVGAAPEKMETIIIGKIEYTKKNNEDWKTRELSGGASSGLGGVVTTAPLETKDLNEYLLVKTTLDNQPSNLFFHYHVFQLENILYFLESRHWLNAEGLIVKSTTKQSNLTPDNITSLNSVDYEYNPKELKIEPPIK